MTWQQVALLLLTALFALSFRVKNLVQRKRTGIDPYRFKKSSSPRQRFLERYGRVVSLLWFGLVVGFALAPAHMPAWGFPLFLDNMPLRYAGFVAAAGFLVGLIAAQWQMRDSWRMGLDEENRTQLVTSGLFRYVRNPVFAMILGYLGAMVLVLPCAATLLLWGMSFTGLYLQVLEEEPFLLRQHGEPYQQYLARTGRFWPRLGSQCDPRLG